MKIVEKKQDGKSIHYEVTANASEVGKALDECGAVFCYQLGIVPPSGVSFAQAAKETAGIGNLDVIVAPRVMDYLVPFAIEKRGITPAFSPKAEAKGDVRRGEAFRFDLEVTPKQEYELSSYDPLVLTVPAIPSAKDQVDAEIARIAARNPSFEPDSPHKVGPHDTCRMSIKCTRENGEAVRGLNTDSRTYPLGKGYMPGGFEEAIVGMDVGETKSFTFTAPSTDADGKTTDVKLNCTVTILEMLKEVLPTIDDAWVLQNEPMYGTLDALRASIEARVTAQLKREHDRYVEQLAVNELAERFQGGIDEAVYEGVMIDLLKTLRNNLKQQNIKFDDYVARNGGEQMFDMMFMMQTQQTLAQGYALDALYRNKKLAYTDEDIAEVCAEMDPQNPEAVRKTMEDLSMGYMLRESAERMCASKWLIEHSTIMEADSAAEPAAK